MQSVEYSLIRRHYGARIALRSGVPLINHIDEAIVILERLGAPRTALKAFCLHPLVQSDDSLSENAAELAVCDPMAVLYAMEYRHYANAYLSHRRIQDLHEIALSPLDPVNMMLKADKVQNRKDFLRHHASTHPRSAQLDQYFKNWLARLGVSDTDYAELTEGL